MKVGNSGVKCSLARNGRAKDGEGEGMATAKSREGDDAAIVESEGICPLR